MSDDAPSQRVATRSGDLLVIVRWADTRWLSWAWSKVLLVYERCLVYSGGHTGSVYGVAAARDGARHAGLAGEQPQWYDVFESVAEHLDAEQLAAERPENWLVWSHHVTAWSLREGVFFSRLRLELVGAEARKVLWSHYTSADVFAEIEPALTRALGAERRRG